MLVLSRRAEEKVIIGDRVVVTVVRVNGERVTLGITAPTGVSIRRGELAPCVKCSEGTTTGYGTLIEQADDGCPSDQFPVASWGGES